MSLGNDEPEREQQQTMQLRLQLQIQNTGQPTTPCYAICSMALEKVFLTMASHPLLKSAHVNLPAVQFVRVCMPCADMLSH